MTCRSTSTVSGTSQVSTGVGFFDHMLTHLARHGLFDLTVKCQGDLHVDAHHTVEDVGICFGKALAQALGDKAGIRRYGDATVPMDETLVTAAVDLSGRPFLVWNADVPSEMLGTFQLAARRGVLAGRRRRRGCSTCTSSCITAATLTTSSRRHSRPSPAPCGKRSSQTRGSGVPSTKGVL